MTLALLGVRLLLALAFLAAGATKLLARQLFASSLAGLGVPRAAVPVATVLIPLAELLTAVLLVPPATARWGGAASLTLLALFTIVAAVSLARGRTPDCACFGRATAEPIGVPTLVRNGLLIALAGLVVLRGGGELWEFGPAWNQATADERILSSAFLALLIVSGSLTVHAGRLRSVNATLSARVAGLERQNRSRVYEQDLGAGGLDVGVPAPTFDVPRLEGDRASLASLIASGKPTALLFLSAHCPSCHELWPDVERWQSQQADRITVAAVCSGSAQTVELKLMGHNVINVLLEGEAHIAEAYALSLRPSAVIVSPSLRIASPSVAGVGAIRLLVERWTRGDQSS